MKTAIEEFREKIKKGLTLEEEMRKWEFIKQLKALEDWPKAPWRRKVPLPKDKQRNKFGVYPYLNTVERKDFPTAIKIAEGIYKEFVEK